MELGRPYSTQLSCKAEVYKPMVKLLSGREGVGGGYSTEDG
ncbi:MULTISPECIES: hypothetical protein [Tissierella]|nr:hypothetical protein [Tissierella sp. P1]